MKRTDDESEPPPPVPHGLSPEAKLAALEERQAQTERWLRSEIKRLRNSSTDLEEEVDNTRVRELIRAATEAQTKAANERMANEALQVALAKAAARRTFYYVLITFAITSPITWALAHYLK